MGHTPRPPSSIRAGERVAHYEILNELGRGGMGVVYRARDLTLGRHVALKCPLPSASEAGRRKRLLREARAAARLASPHIVPIFEVLEHEGVPWLAMELVEGTSLAGLIAARHPLPVKEVLRYAEGIASALDAAHAQNILHRDVKPSNVLVSGDGRLQVTDFGLAQFVGLSEGSPTHTHDSDLDRPDHVAGTFRYMSPEQALGKPLDARSDLFSLGALLYELCTGEYAFPGDGPELYDALLHRAPKAISRRNWEVPDALERLVRKCLAKDPEERYQSAREVLADIRALRRTLDSESRLEESIAAPRRGRVPRGLKWWAAGGAVLLALAFFIATRVRQPARPAAGRSAAAASLVVVPFENATGDRAWTHLARGLSDDLARELQRTGLSVKSRESAALLAGLDDATISQRLNVDRTARGRLSLAGEDILLDVWLTDAATAAEVWTRTYRQPLTRLSQLHGILARDIAEHNGARPRGSAPAVSATSFKAYEAYHRGRVYWEQRTKEGLLQSIDHFKQATALEPRYAQAWAGMADAYLGLGVPTFGAFRPQEVRRLANEAALKALDLDPTLAEVHASLAYASYAYDWNWSAAEERFRKAIELNPQYATAHHWYADYLTAMGRSEEALREIRIACRLEPLSILLHRDVAWHHFFRGDYDAAVAQLRDTLRIDPRYAAARSLLGRALVESGAHAQGLAVLQEVAPDLPRPAALAFLAYAEAASGQSARAEARLRELSTRASTEYVSPYYIALVHVRLGQTAQALASLEKGFADHDTTMTTLAVDPRLKPLRTEPRLRELVERMNLPALETPMLSTPADLPSRSSPPESM